jgi:hypothetical protein
MMQRYVRQSLLVGLKTRSPGVKSGAARKPAISPYEEAVTMTVTAIAWESDVPWVPVTTMV